MIKRLCALCVLCILELANASQELPASSFVLRHPDSNLAEYEANLKLSAQISYVDWLLFEAKKKENDLSDLNQALELTSQNPLKSLNYFRAAVEELNENILNTEGRELLVSIYLKIFKLKVPDRIKRIYHDRARDLIALHPELKRISEFRNFYDTSKSEKSSSTVLRQKEVLLFVKKWGQQKGLEDALLLTDGVPQKILTSWKPAQGMHQWAIVSNTYLPLVIFGSWNEFFNKMMMPDSLKMIISGNCSHLNLESDDYILQTQALLFFSSSCTPLQKTSRALSGHLTSFPEIKEEKKTWWIPALLIVGAGLVYQGLRDKDISIRFPSFQ